MATASSFLGTAVASPASLGELKASSSPSQLVVKASTTRDNDKRKNALSLAAAAILIGGTFGGSFGVEQAKAGLVEDVLARSAANKELNDKKRLATSGANFARANTVLFNTCKFPENFTGCHDLAKKKEVKYLTEDLQIECEGKDKFKCGSNVFWKWGSP